MGNKGRGSQFISHSYLGQDVPANFKKGKHDKSPVNLNTDDLKRIADIPLIGDYRARDIIAHRPFKSWEEVARVPGITKEMIEAMKSGRATI
ncbi:MAG TPA: helix-hairpin-helix domain-containing protein [Ignavibacteriales bacterium]|nr:helix-hairpin-helix domain-containing protein [Ignavibacteriales bacterium]